MERYYVNDNPQPNGDHEVHVEGCSFLKLANSTTYLGRFSDCKPAVEEAKKIYPKSDGGAFCCPKCHKS